MKTKKIEAGIAPRPKGHSPKGTVPPDVDKEKDYEIKRLGMENELLRDFLRAVGRK